MRDDTCALCGRRSCTGECELSRCYECGDALCGGDCGAGEPASYAQLTDPPPAFVAARAHANAAHASALVRRAYRKATCPRCGFDPEARCAACQEEYDGDTTTNRRGE